jgi:hydrophobe/amphiphile efflux-3 (HAE3) family protein
MAGFIFKYRWIIVILCGLTGAVSVLVIPQIRVDPEMRNYVPSFIGSRIETDKIEKQFGVQDMVMIMFSDSCIITTDNLNQIKSIDRSISRINGVSGMVSPFTVRSIRNEEGMVVVDPLIGNIPDDSTELRKLGREILSNRFARGIVISSDLTAASITATISNSEAEVTVLHTIDSVLSSYRGTTKILKGGLPYIRQSVMNDVSKDAVFLVPLALIVMLLVLKFNLGLWRLVAMPFSVVLLSTAFSLALIPALGWKMSMVTLLLPVILVAVANNYGIYLMARYQELKRANGRASKRELVMLLTGSLNIPILFSGLTTVAGILGLLCHSITPARQVGILAAAGVSLALLLSLILIPALIFISSNSSALLKSKNDKTQIFKNVLTWLSEVIIKNPGRILVISGISILIISSGIFFLRINTNQETYFPMKHPVRQASEEINSKFGGSQTISVMIEGDIYDPAVMQGIDTLTKQAELEAGVGSVISISQVIREMSMVIFSIGEDGYDMIPRTRDAIAQMFELYNMSGDPDDLKQLMNLENTAAHVLIRISDPENKVVIRVKERISRLTSAIPARVTVGGYAIIMADFASSIIRGQVYSLLFAVVIVLILLAIIFKSFRGGMIGSVPLVASIFILFGFMGLAGIAIDAATALLSSVMIGVGVDFTIQYIWCFNQQIKSGLPYPEATRSALGTIGRSIIINALSVMAGFSALIFSGFMSIRFFGYLVLVSIGSCLIGAIVIVPAILMKYRPRFIGYNLNHKTQEK